MDDLEFVQSCVKGDSSSWNEFLSRYSRLIYNYIHSVIKSKGYPYSPEEIQDIFQELFASLIQDNYKKLRSFKAKNGCSLASWLRQVTINFTLDYTRKAKPVLSLDAEINEESSLQDILADGSEPIPDKLSLEEKLNSLKDCISKLNSDDKYFLELHINQGVKLEALIGTLKMSRGAIDMQKARITERLRECFKNKGFMLDF
jgi:RNA polymerase sigma-70 factor (ECF subfamily)